MNISKIIYTGDIELAEKSAKSTVTYDKTARPVFMSKRVEIIIKLNAHHIEKMPLVSKSWFANCPDVVPDELYYLFNQTFVFTRHAYNTLIKLKLSINANIFFSKLTLNDVIWLSKTSDAWLATRTSILNNFKYVDEFCELVKPQYDKYYDILFKLRPGYMCNTINDRNAWQMYKDNKNVIKYISTECTPVARMISNDMKINNPIVYNLLHNDPPTMF